MAMKVKLRQQKQSCISQECFKKLSAEAI